MLGHGYRLRRHPDFFGLHRRRLCDCQIFPEASLMAAVFLVGLAILNITLAIVT